ncbi:MAG: hypothetical protein K2P26_05095 [Oscillospiraceae bacterium]|nr:hypothetical protein [Oscillospiraceae bacterium]
MNIPTNMPAMSASWFTGFNDGKGFDVKPEHVKDFLACCEEQDRVYREAEASYVKRVPMQVKLTDEQKKYLAETYERTDMTEEEYHAFAKDLYEFGILDDQDLADLGVTPGDGSADFFGACMLVGVGGMTTSTVRYSPLPPNQNYLGIYRFGGGNVLDWARYQASFQLCDTDTQSWGYDRFGHLFNRLYSVLEQM